MDEQMTMEQYFHEVENEKVEQAVTISTEERPVPDLHIGDTVKVIAKADDEHNDVETSGYLSIYEGKTGKLIRINEKSNPICYEVDFGGNVKYGLFYAEQIKSI